MEKGLHFHYEISPDAPQFIRTDRLRLLQILTNLVGNAIKFTAAGRVQLKVTATPMEAPSSIWNWRLAVDDTDCGITPAVRKKLFLPFYQTDSSAAE